MRCLPICLVLALAGTALAADPPPPGDGLGASGDALLGWTAVEQGRWVQARALGERLVAQAPGDYPGHFILGATMHYGEGDLARSAYHLDLAMRHFEARHGDKPDKSKPWRWHSAILKELGFTYGELDRPADELVIFDKFDAAYTPKRTGLRVWPLMKLRRYEAARLAAKEAIASGDSEQRIIARSDLCAAECEAGNRERAFTACTDALADYKGPKSGGQVEFSNAGEAALSVLRFDQAEQLLRESTQRAVPDSWGNPFQGLAGLYLLEGRVAEAIAALRGARDLRSRRPAWLDQHGQARLDGTLADVLILAGLAERAVYVAQRAVDRPDRQGVQSGTERQARAASALRLAAALGEQAAQTEEQGATAGFVDGWRLRGRAGWLRLRAFRERRRAAVLFADGDFLQRSLRPYYVGGVDLMPWLAFDLVGAVGGGVVLAAVQQSRAVEPLAGAAPYFVALAAEAHFARGDDQSARAAAEEALRTLPKAEVLLGARLAAIAGETARRLGDEPAAADRLLLAMTRDPGVVRRLGLALPVTVESDGSRLGAEAGRWVGRSPRFRTGEAGFFITLRAAGRGGEACLLGPSRLRLRCATRLPSPGESPSTEALARELIGELHRVAFALEVNLSQADLTSLDGSPTSQRADRQVKTLLDELGE